MENPKKIASLNMSQLIGGKVCEEFTPGYYGVCAIGGMLSAGTTHVVITPLDVLKVNMQVYLSSLFYKSSELVTRVQKGQIFDDSLIYD